MDDLFDLMTEEGAHHVAVWTDKDSGLRALCVVDDVRLGPATGGIRTQPYPSVQHALADAVKLARAMTLKTALAGLRAGGGKIVVLETGEMDREAAFRVLGRRLADLGGTFRAGPDLGTRSSDLTTVAAETSYVHANMARVSRAVAQGVRSCIEACARVKKHAGVGDLRVAVQGCGAVGAAVARELAAAGASLVVADVDHARARVLSEETGAEVVAPAAIFAADVDVFSPCAMGGVLTPARVRDLSAWAICGGANNVLATSSAADILVEREILHVPDVIASAGGVIEGIGHDVMGLDSTASLVANLGRLAEEVLLTAQERKVSPDVIAYELAQKRLEGR